jgi:hypothetical protein
MKTTLNKIREKSPCATGWSRLLAHLGKTKGDDEPLSIATIIEANGLSDALWCLRAVEGHDKEIRLFAVWCARQVQNLMKDPRSVAALDVAEAYANGMATFAELKAAEATSWDAARVSARVAARAAARGASRDAAGAAWDAAGAAAEAAAGEAPWAAARDAQKQELLRICAEIESEKGQT